MKIARTYKQRHIGLLICFSALVSAVAAEEVDSSIANCLNAWSKHPFGINPQNNKLSTSVKVFGFGHDSAVTVMGSTQVQRVGCD